MKRILVTALSALLIATMAIGGSVAYLTSTDNAANIFEMGEVKIKQIEEERDGSGMKEFADDHLLLPAHQFQQTGSVDTNKSEENWDTATGAVDKFVRVENEGKSDAWVRTIFAFENTGDIDGKGWIFKNVSDERVGSFEAVTGEDDVQVSIEYEEKNYNLYVFTYKDALEPNETTGYSLKQVAMAAQADNEVVAAIRGEDGNGRYTILVATQAVQVANMKKTNDDGELVAMTAAEALDEAFGAITDENNPWLTGENEGADDDDDDENVIEISSAEGLLSFAQQVNGTAAAARSTTADDFKGKTVKLTCDIDLKDVDSWTPIGNQTNYFAGTFDGGNHTIKNLKIEQTTEMNADWEIVPTPSCYVGLFGYSKGMTVKDLTIDNQGLTSDNRSLTIDNAHITGNSCVGAIVGEGSGITIKNCHVKNAVINCAFFNTGNSEEDEGYEEDNVIDLPDEFKTDPYANGGYAGGIVGYIEANGNVGSKIEGCTVENIKVYTHCNGGFIAGFAKESSVSRCSKTGSENQLDGVQCSDDPGKACGYCSINTDGTLVGGILDENL